MTPTVVAKVGGSLFDLPDLRQRLTAWITTLGDRTVLIVPGGGRGADVIRQLDQTHRLGEPAAHSLALKVLTVNAYFLAGLLDVPVISSVVRTVHPVNVLDPNDLCSAGGIEHSWRVTSDSIAAHAATRAAGELVLLKSIDLPSGTTWTTAARDGLVDKAFADVVSGSGIRVSWVNLRRFTGTSRK